MRQRGGATKALGWQIRSNDGAGRKAVSFTSSVPLLLFVHHAKYVTSMKAMKEALYNESITIPLMPLHFGKGRQSPKGTAFLSFPGVRSARFIQITL